MSNNLVNNNPASVPVGLHSPVYLSSTLLVSVATVQDLPQIVAIYNQSVAGKQATADLTPVDIEDRQAWFALHECDPKRPIYVVRYVQDAPADDQHGMSMQDLATISTTTKAANVDASITDSSITDSPIIAWGSFSDLYSRPAYHISSEISLYIHRDARGQGIGGCLLSWMLEQAPSLDIHNVLALVFAHNTPSVRLFNKFGFAKWGCLPQVCDMQGFLADVLMLGLALNTDNVSIHVYNVNCRRIGRGYAPPNSITPLKGGGFNH